MFVLLALAGWAAGAWYLARVPTPTPGPRSGAAAARVSVIVPARDEAATLPRLLTTLAQLDASPHEVIVVDDGSRDATAAVARAHGATVLPAGASPAGWAGKPWACHVGAGVASGTHLLFLDADTWLAPDALGRLLAEHARVGGLVSVQPYHEPQRAYEQLSAYCNVVAMMGTGAFAPHPPAGARAAFGPCLLTTAADYEAAGGHAAAPGAVLEDVLLARRYRAAGMPVTLFGGGDVVRFRMYPAGVTQLVDGWSKNMASGAAATDRVAAAATVLWISAGVAVSLAVVTGLARWMRGVAGAPLVAVAAYVVTAVQFRFLLRRVGAFRRWTACLFPVPLAAFIGIFVRSLALTFVRRRVTWRGREIPIERGGAR